MPTVSWALAQCVGALVALWCAAALVRYVRWRLYWHGVLRPFGGPPVALPVLGSLLYVVGPMDTIFARGLKLMMQYGCGHYGTFWLGERPWLHIMRPEDVESVLSSNKHITKPEVVYGPVSGFLGRYGALTF